MKLPEQKPTEPPTTGCRSTFALRATGASMIGKHILDCDIVVLEHGPEPRHGDAVAALIEGESTLKTFLKMNGQPDLKAENPKYPGRISRLL